MTYIKIPAKIYYSIVDDHDFDFYDRANTRHNKGTIYLSVPTRLIHDRNYLELLDYEVFPMEKELCLNLFIK